MNDDTTYVLLEALKEYAAATDQLLRGVIDLLHQRFPELTGPLVVLLTEQARQVKAATLLLTPEFTDD